MPFAACGVGDIATGDGNDASADVAPFDSGHPSGDADSGNQKDTTEHPSLYTSATVHGGNAKPYRLPMFDNVWMGWQEYQSSTEDFEMWLDEIAVDHNRIGCVL